MINTLYEKMIVEKLIEGTKSRLVYPTIAPDTKLLGVSVKDDICYVNLDERFLSTVYSLDPKVTIYSIVNSLSELSTVSRVQIRINGSEDAVFRDLIPLNTVFERNYEYIEGGKTD